MEEKSTSRLVIRALCPDDLLFMMKLTSNADVLRYLPGMITDEDMLRDWLHSLSPKDKEYILIHHESDTPIGECSLTLSSDNRSCEIGYMLLPEFWDRGYGTETARWLIDLADQIGVEKVTAAVHHRNTASKHILDKLGFQKEAVEWVLRNTTDGLLDDCLETYMLIL